MNTLTQRTNLRFMRQNDGHWAAKIGACAHQLSRSGILGSGLAPPVHVSCVCPAGGPLTLQDHLVSSVFAGGVVSFVASPTELVKCRLQHQGTFESARLRLTAWERGGKRGDRPTLYRGPWDVLRDVYVNERGLRGCFNGLGATLLREMAG